MALALDRKIARVSSTAVFTLWENLPPRILMSGPVMPVASSNYEKRQVAARTLGDIVTRDRESVLVSVRS